MPAAVKYKSITGEVKNIKVFQDKLNQLHADGYTDLVDVFSGTDGVKIWATYSNPSV